MKKRNGLSVFLLAMPYVCILAVSLLSTLWLGNQVLSGYRTAVVKEKEKSIELAFERFLKRTDEIESFSLSVAQNEVLTDYFWDAVRQRGHSVVQRKKVQEMLHDMLSVAGIRYAYLYDTKEGCVISNDLALSDADTFYRYKYRIEGYTPRESGRYVLRMENGYNPAVNVAIGGNTGVRMLEYKSCVPLASSVVYKDQLILVLSAGNVFRDLETTLGTDGVFYVYGGSGGGLLYANGDRYADDAGVLLTSGLARVEGAEAGGEVYGMECVSTDCAWRIRFYMDGSGWKAADRNAILSLLATVMFPLLAGMALCVVFTLKKYQEITEIIGMFGSRGQGAPQQQAEEKASDARAADAADDEIISYGLVRQYVSRMVSENTQFRTNAANGAAARRYEALDRLLRHNFESREEMERLLGSVDLRIRTRNCAVLCIRFEKDSYRARIADQTTVKDLFREMLEEIAGRNFESFDPSARETVCLFSLNADDDWQQLAHDMVSGIKAGFLYRYDLKAEFGAGNVADSIYEVGDAYRKAREVIRYNETSENKILLYDELARMETGYSYPPETDDRIVNYVAAGYPEEAKAVIREIIRLNFEDPQRKLSEKAAAAVKKRLWDTVQELAQKYDAGGG